MLQGRNYARGEGGEVQDLARAEKCFLWAIDVGGDDENALAELVMLLFDSDRFGTI